MSSANFCVSLPVPAGLCASISLHFLFQRVGATRLGATSRRSTAARTVRAGSPGRRTCADTCGTAAAKGQGSSVRTARCTRKRSRTCTGTSGPSIEGCASSSSTWPPIDSSTRGRINVETGWIDPFKPDVH